jgi:hypothetical protein
MLTDVYPLEDPDGALMAWMNQEEKLFRRMERHEVDKKLKEGFVTEEGTDVNGFLKFSLCVQNTRKSRAGLALENHMEEILRIHGIQYDRNSETENGAKPDFLFPGATRYHTPSFPDTLLTMLGVKTTCKDRWSQVLIEAGRIRNKHLLTLEPAISENQTTEMKAHNLQLVLPKPIHETYRDQQKQWIMNIQDFIALLAEKQGRSADI